jgi:heat shock protein HslJ
VHYASVSGQAITDAPPLSEPPQMIEVEAVFLDELPTETQAEVAEIATDEIESSAADTSAMADAQVETAALGPIETPAPLEIEVDLPEPVVTEQEAMAEVVETVETAETVVTEPADLSTQMASIDTSKLSAPIVEDQPTVEIADDLGDLKELSGTSWRLEMLNGKDVPATAELHFDGSSGFAGGQGICNNYGGEFSETLKGSFDMGNIFSTETKCEHFGLEREYIVALEGASGYRTTPGQGELQLLDARGRVVATFAAF